MHSGRGPDCLLAHMSFAILVFGTSVDCPHGHDIRSGSGERYLHAARIDHGRQVDGDRRVDDDSQVGDHGHVGDRLMNGDLLREEDSHVDDGRHVDDHLMNGGLLREKDSLDDDDDDDDDDDGGGLLHEHKDLDVHDCLADEGVFLREDYSVVADGCLHDFAPLCHLAVRLLVLVHRAARVHGSSEHVYEGGPILERDQVEFRRRHLHRHCPKHRGSERLGLERHGHRRGRERRSTEGQILESVVVDIRVLACLQRGIFQRNGIYDSSD